MVFHRTLFVGVSFIINNNNLIIIIIIMITYIITILLVIYALIIYQKQFTVFKLKRDQPMQTIENHH